MSETTFPNSWELCEFGDVARIRNGYAFKSTCFKKTRVQPDDVPLIRQSQLKGSKVDLTDAVYLSASFLDQHSAYSIKKGDIIIGMSGSIGKVCRYEDSIVSLQNQRTGKIELHSVDALDSNFLGLFLSTVERTLVEKAKGMGVQNISGKDIAALPFSLPPLNEQKRIVAKIEELFSEIDAGEESLRQARRQLGVYRQSLLKQAFEGKLTAQWRKQNPDLLESPDQLLTRIQAERQTRFEQQVEEWEIAFEESKAKGEKKPPKPSILKPVTGKTNIFKAELPSEWSSLNLSQIALELGQGWSPKCLSEAANPEVWGVMKTTAIQPGRFQSEASKVLPPDLSPRPWLGLRHNDILITRAGPRSRCGVVCRVEGDHPMLLLCDKAYRLAFSEEATSSAFIELLLCSPVASDAIEKLKTGINDSGVNITQTSFLQLVVPLPSLPEQQEIVRLLDEQFTVIEQNEREIDAALKRSEALRQSILKKAFTGHLVPQDPTDEPAKELLARIREEREEAILLAKKTVKKTTQKSKKSAKSSKKFT